MPFANEGSEAPLEEQLASFVTELSFEDVPRESRESVVRAFVDTIGVALAGVETPVAQAGSRLTGGSSRSVTEKALWLGTIAHALDYDDLSWGLDGHPSVFLIPPILAHAEERSITGPEAITAYTAGFETACAIAQPISPDHYGLGWHPTATFGAFGSAATTAHLLDLDPDQTRRALNIAASTPAGLKRNFGSMTKPLHAGFASRSGVTAAILASEGVTADETAISGANGFWELYGDRVEPAPARAEMDEWFLRTEGIHVKLYPCCYFTHSSIAAAETLVERNDIDPESVESVSVTASQGAADALQHRTPSTGLEAKFSMEYAVACGIARNRVGLDAFEDAAVDDPTVNAVRNRVEFAPDPELPYHSHEATVVIETRSGTYETTRTDPPGVHSDPPSESDLESKFHECATRSVSVETAERVFDELITLPKLDGLENVTSAFRQ